MPPASEGARGKMAGSKTLRLRSGQADPLYGHTRLARKTESDTSNTACIPLLFSGLTCQW